LNDERPLRAPVLPEQRKVTDGKVDQLLPVVPPLRTRRFFAQWLATFCGSRLRALVVLSVLLARRSGSERPLWAPVPLE